MPREPRVYIEKILYFITAKVNDGRTLFHDDQDYAEYLKPLSEYKLLNGFKLYAYALTPKQIFLLVELRNHVTISTVMHNLNSRYSKIYNSRYGTKGHLFQGRFKSILVEKEEYLLRLTRYVHMLPGQFKENPYSSYHTFISKNSDGYNVLNKPDMAEEIKEVLMCLGKNGTDEELKSAYKGYVESAGKSEIKEINKIMHRTSIVGSQKFIKDVKNQIEKCVRKEKESKVVRKSNPVFMFTGTLIALFLCFVSFKLYGNQSKLQNTLNVTGNGFEVAREDFTNRVNALKSELTGFEVVKEDLTKQVSQLQNELNGLEGKEIQRLGGFAWRLHFRPVQEEPTDENYFDDLQFRGGKVISAALLAKGFSPFDYTISRQSHGQMIWQTTQTNADGLTVRWYGVVSGKNMRGVLSESSAQGKSRDFSFVSITENKNSL